VLPGGCIVVEKLRKRTLRERVYKRSVRLILFGELPSGGWVDEKRVIDKAVVRRTPFREENSYWQRRTRRDQAFRRLLCSQLSPRISFEREQSQGKQ
jgi:hypothetical protein